MAPDAQSRIQAALVRGETLLWFGEPDRGVLRQTLGEGRGSGGLFAGLIAWFRGRPLGAPGDQLAYGITNRRLLIVRDREVLASVSPVQLQGVELEECGGARGYSDIIWHHRGLSEAGAASTPGAGEREQGRLGFKALVDGPAVLERIECWQRRHRQAADEITRAGRSDVADDRDGVGNRPGRNP